uniref:EVA1 domain-containing protein n=2 Tax=Octopus bimaculoides TaxID=37653 RepID=A0A0L8ICL4_OCTBM
MKAILTMRPFHNKWRTSAPSSSTASSTTVATTTTTTTTTTASTSTTTTTTTFRTSIRNIAAGVLVIPTPSTPESKTEIDQRNSLGHDGLSPQHTDNVGSPERGVGRKGSVAESSSVAPLETQSNVDPNVHCVNTTHFVSKVKKQPASVLSDWLGVFYIIQKNKEKALLYFLLGISLGTICILLIVVVKLIFVNKRKLQAKLDLTEPTHSQNATPNNHVPKHSSPTALRRATSDEFVDFMGYSPRSGTLRTESGNRSLNYF